MSMDANKTPKVENLPELITNRRVGGMDMITAVRHPLLADIFVLMIRSYPFLNLQLFGFSKKQIT